VAGKYDGGVLDYSFQKEKKEISGASPSLLPKLRLLLNI